jgi:tetratricopeptide (TPR) repeat protein
MQLPAFLRMAYAFRFGDSASRTQATGSLSRSPEALALAARGALSFDLPEAQAALGAALAAAAPSVEQRASGHVARGVALVALGRPAAAQVSFDSAAALFPEPLEARLQAAAWRVIPPALGAVGWSAGDRERGRTALREMSGDPAVGLRAAWALALDAHARGDSAETRRWSGTVKAWNDRPIALTWAGIEAAARGDWGTALARTSPVLAYDSAGHAPDPFLRAVLHLKRGEWLQRAGRAGEADRSWLWYENLDLRSWPAAEAQPAEVDWALATHARALRARSALERGDRAQGCALARRVVEVWAAAEPAAAAERDALAALARGCPG